MAIWQYKLTALPEAGIRLREGQLPDQLFIDHAGWKEYWNKLGDGPGPEDAYTIDWWGNLQTAAPIVIEVDAVLRRETWYEQGADFFRWKGDAQGNDHDACLSADAVGEYVEAFDFRTDLREPEAAIGFLKAMLSICQQYCLLVMDANGKLTAPRLEDVLPSIQQSSAVRFLTSPHEFLSQVVADLPTTEPDEKHN